MLDCTIMVFPFRHVELAIPDHNHTEKGNWTISCVSTGHLVIDLQVHIKLQSRYHTQLLTGFRKEI